MRWHDCRRWERYKLPCPSPYLKEHEEIENHGRVPKQQPQPHQNAPGQDASTWPTDANALANVQYATGDPYVAPVADAITKYSVPGIKNPLQIGGQMGAAWTNMMEEHLTETLWQAKQSKINVLEQNPAQFREMYGFDPGGEFLRNLNVAKMIEILSMPNAPGNVVRDLKGMPVYGSKHTENLMRAIQEQRNWYQQQWQQPKNRFKGGAPGGTMEKGGGLGNPPAIIRPTHFRKAAQKRIERKFRPYVARSRVSWAPYTRDAQWL